MSNLSNHPTSRTRDTNEHNTNASSRIEPTNTLQNSSSTTRGDGTENDNSNNNNNDNNIIVSPNAATAPTTTTTAAAFTENGNLTPLRGVLPRSRSNSVTSSIRGSNTTPVRIPTPTTSSGRQRSTTPTSASSSLYHSILNRPRSNPRSRTPMRTESPLNANAFRRDSIHEDDNDEEQHPQQQSTATTHHTIPTATLVSTRTGSRSRSRRPLTAGAPVGTTTTSLRFRQGEKSLKQQPSQRKLRRWKNDSVKGLAHEFAKENTKSGMKIAQVYLEAHANASKYKCIYQPSHPQHQSFSTMFQEQPPPPPKKTHQDGTYLQDKFFRGEIGGTPGTSGTSYNSRHEESSTTTTIPTITPLHMWNRVHGRLRNVILRLMDSPSATMTIERLESYLASTLSSSCSTSPSATTSSEAIMHSPSSSSSFWWKDAEKQELLLPNWLVQIPQETKIPKSQKLMIKFTFPKDAGLERLFLHAICQFHGLHTASMDDHTNTTTTTTTNGSSKKSNKKTKKGNRCIMVSGKMEGSTVRLLETVQKEQHQHGQDCVKTPTHPKHNSDSGSGDKQKNQKDESNKQLSDMTLQMATVKVVE
eukprot:CAMPEP_0195281216 /NCGR_PEP_ID=MMETSP0707-20130614/627_1 /TAXON_ID=33640 /ORGANISM="Asterionellopsis glacialis, Strain CCMP134" /LENGTH=586 /DNA_ID=CAMNT_0040340085 /DNA_START=82 /DNA_END=1842 /DNA_ORIENTATION=-